jgi:hypothetical protein
MIGWRQNVINDLCIIFFSLWIKFRFVFITKIYKFELINDKVKWIKLWFFYTFLFVCNILIHNYKRCRIHVFVLLSETTREMKKRAGGLTRNFIFSQVWYVSINFLLKEYINSDDKKNVLLFLLLLSLYSKHLQSVLSFFYWCCTFSLWFRYEKRTRYFEHLS